MKTKLFVLILMAVFLRLDGAIASSEEIAVAVVEKDKAAVEVVDVGNKICPISGEKVGEMGEIVKHEYNGKSYNLCCSMCLRDFKNDPEKFSRIAEDEVAKEAVVDNSEKVQEQK